jgi:hypothetical protein
VARIAMQQNDESGSPVRWGRHVTDQSDGAHRARHLTIKQRARIWSRMLRVLI